MGEGPRRAILPKVRAPRQKGNIPFIVPIQPAEGRSLQRSGQGAAGPHGRALFEFSPLQLILDDIECKSELFLRYHEGWYEGEDIGSWPLGQEYQPPL